MHRINGAVLMAPRSRNLPEPDRLTPPNYRHEVYEADLAQRFDRWLGLSMSRSDRQRRTGRWRSGPAGPDGRR
jgi:hypothetical protein